MECGRLKFKPTVIFLSFRTDRSGQTVQTQIRLLLIRVYTVCHSVCIVWTHSSMVEPPSSNFRVITTNFWGVRIFRKFTVLPLVFSTTCTVKIQKFGHPKMCCNHPKSIIDLVRKRMHVAWKELPISEIKYPTLRQPFSDFVCNIWAISWENLFIALVNNKDMDQPVHLHSLISTFVVRCLYSIMPTVAIPEIRRHMISSG